VNYYKKRVNYYKKRVNYYKLFDLQ
jgi:hypothetical protein